MLKNTTIALLAALLGGLFAAPALAAYPGQTTRPWAMVTDPNFGAVCDGVTNDAAALQAAFNAGGTVVIPAGKTCFTNTGLTASNGTSIVSETNPTSNPTTGAVILCANTVTTCLTLAGPQSGVSGAGGISIRGFGVGFSGTPGGSSIAIKIATTWLPAISDMQAFNAAIGYEFVTTGIYGISSRAERLSTCQITDAHIVLDGWPEFRGTQLRLGCNNDGVNSNDYIRFQNTAGAPSNAPNTTYIDNSQFNAGGSQVGCWLHFVGITNTKNEFNFAQNHVEAVNSGVCSDVTSTGLLRFILTGNYFLDNSASHDFFSGMNSATQIGDWVFTGNQWNGWTGWTLAPSGQINAITATGNRWNQTPISITGVSNSQITFQGNMYAGITLAGNFAYSIVSGVSPAGSVTNNATGPISFINKTAWTPVLNFGGATTGITYTTQLANWQINGKTLTFSFVITLSSKGSASGAATITGLPQTCGQLGTTALYSTGMSTLGGAPVAQISSATINLYQDGATGVGTLSDTNFTNTSSIQGSISCLL